MELPVRSIEGGCILTVRVTPNAASDKIEGLAEDDAGRVFLKVRVRAVPEKGAANKAVCQVIAKALELPKSAVSVRAGDTVRIKQLYIPMDSDDVSQLISVWVH